MKLIIVGATGAVGLEIIKILETHNIPYNDLDLVASESSVNTPFEIKGIEYHTTTLTPNTFVGADYAILAVSSELSKKCVELRDKSDSSCIIIDNSSAFRMDKNVPLIIPEINMTYGTKIIANPNCSTILMLMVVSPLYRENKITQIDVCTYQAASGAGLKGMEELMSQAQSYITGNELSTECFGRQYIFNAFSHNSPIDPHSGFNGEEIKMIKETKKILEDDDIIINPTCIRIPTLRSHMESLTIKFENPTTVDEIRGNLFFSPGVTVYDNPKQNQFPEPIVTQEKDDVYVGRIRQSYHNDPTVFQLILSGDQIRKGAALNSIQIYESLIEFV